MDAMAAISKLNQQNPGYFRHHKSHHHRFPPPRAPHVKYGKLCEGLSFQRPKNAAFLVGKGWRYGCLTKNSGKTSKMDGENNRKPYEQMDDLGVPLFLETPI